MQIAAWHKSGAPSPNFTVGRSAKAHLSSSHRRSSAPDSGPPSRPRGAVTASCACSRQDAQAEASTSGRTSWQSSCTYRQQPVRSSRTQTVAASTSADASTGAASGLPDLPIPDIPVRGKGLGSLALRVIFGTVLGLLGAIVITAGGWMFTGAVCLVAYQATQEFFGFMTSKGVSEGQSPPSPVVSALTTAMCLGLSIWTHITHGRATAALAVASFAVLAVHVSLTEKPTTAQLASAVFGLFYCGKMPFQLQCCACVCLKRCHQHPPMIVSVTQEA